MKRLYRLVVLFLLLVVVFLEGCGPPTPLPKETVEVQFLAAFIRRPPDVVEFRYKEGDEYVRQSQGPMVPGEPMIFVVKVPLTDFPKDFGFETTYFKSESPHDPHDEYESGVGIRVWPPPEGTRMIGYTVVFESIWGIVELSNSYSRNAISSPRYFK